MFCPKCGTENPETGRFCRSCGTDLGNVTDALSGKLQHSQEFLDCKGKPVNWDRAVRTMFMGVAFLIVTCVLAFTGTGRGWWFWMLIPAFSILSAGVAQLVQLKKAERRGIGFAPPAQRSFTAASNGYGLPSSRADYVTPPESRYKTGELAPPSVTEGTTRHLETSSEGETMTLPKI